MIGELGRGASAGSAALFTENKCLKKKKITVSQAHASNLSPAIYILKCFYYNLRSTVSAGFVFKSTHSNPVPGKIKLR